MPKLARYIDDEAEHSGSADSSENESLSDHSSFIDDSEIIEHKEQKFKKPKTEHKMEPELKMETKIEKPKLLSNKTIQESSIPPKPKNLGVQKLSTSKKFDFRLSFTNGAMFYKFLLPIANAVNELRFNLATTPEFTGLRLEAHDTYLTLANKSRYECDIDTGDVDAEDLFFCVSATSFMQTLGCATLKDTVLMITKYSGDKMTFESITNESDVQTVYECDLLAESRLESLKGMQFNLGFHVNLNMKTLKDHTSNAKKCGASTIYFELFQSKDEKDDTIVHSKLSLGFKGNSTSGSHDFYQSAKCLSDGDVVEWQPIAGLDFNTRSKTAMERKSYNEYDNSKLRLFLSHMDIEWVLIHLCNDNSQKPLVMECVIGGKNTKHTIIVAPKMDANREV